MPTSRRIHSSHSRERESSQGKHASHSGNQPHGRGHEQKLAGDDQFEPPKVWDIKDPFTYAPAKPERDPWTTLLEPLMEKDKMRCEAWNAEVQNLLIFAGLFSAVVTAFIIESYKKLLPDPNDTLVDLLSVIVARLDNTTNAMSVSPSTVPFKPTASSIRINTFWFISLVVSLATVLFGIISLQWIREHQSYPNVSPKEAYALFHMRSEGLQKWHVPKVFTALPLLLQSALVLFLAGIIEFLLAFGDVLVIIPVSVVTGLVLLFLVATTLLPTLQGLLLLLPYPYSRTSKTPPSQCPYKSPQAHAFRTIFGHAIWVFSHNKYRWDRISNNFIAYVWTTLAQHTWTQFDLAWLRLRDTYTRRPYNLPWLRYNETNKKDFPVFDLTWGLMRSIWNPETESIKNSLRAQYHCFVEISESVISVTPDAYGRKDDSRLQFNAYFRDVMYRAIWLGDAINHYRPLQDFFDLNVERKSEDDRHTLLHHDNVYVFTQFLAEKRDLGKQLLAHQYELTMRLSAYFMGKRHKLRHPPEDYSTWWHDCLENHLYFNRPDRPRREISGEVYYFEGSEDFDLLFWQWLNSVMSLLQSATQVGPPYTAERTLYTCSRLARHLLEAGHATSRAASRYNEHEHGLRLAIRNKYATIFQFLSDNLKEQMSHATLDKPNLLFYATALYLGGMDREGLTFYPQHSWDDLLTAMLKYKECTIDQGKFDTDLENIFNLYPEGIHNDARFYRSQYRVTPFKTFSPEWWNTALERFEQND